MNIFYLDESPEVAATYHCDKHVVKMILESAQLLCTALNVSAGEQITPYKTTHVNHPCSIWIRQSYANWKYVWELMFALDDERMFRYARGIPHKSVTLLSESPILSDAEKLLPKKNFSLPALAMPDHCKISNDPVECYREYYRKEKQDLLKYTNREKPFWLDE